MSAPSSNNPVPPTPEGAPESGVDRRAFLAGAGGIAALGAGASLLPALTGSNAAQATPSPATPFERSQGAYRVRIGCALRNFNEPLVAHPTNGDETLYGDRIGNFSKGLPHNTFGEVAPAAYTAFLAAVAGRTQFGFEIIPSGCPNSAQRMKLVNPLGGLAYDLQGVDAHNTTTPPPPAFASAEEASEIVENYWMALLRDIPFSQYDSHPTVAAACADLTAMSDFRGPKVGGQVTPQTLFRDAAPGVTVGPYLSQFWWRSQPFGAQHVEPRIRTRLPNLNYGTTEASWLALQNGFRPTALAGHDATQRYMRNGRDLSEWVHIDVLFQGYFQALLTMMAAPDPNNPFTGGGLGVAPNPGNPYIVSLMQDGFTTFGGPHFATLTPEVSTRALKATWFQKWFTHRRLRPEEFAGRVHHKLANGRPYPIHADVLNSAALPLVQALNGGTFLLPLAYPEGCPIHPAYTAGHATVAGACVTIIKALFYTDGPFPNPLFPNDDGTALFPYTGPGANQMTITGELNKIAANVAYGRNIAGVHWRSDGYESLRLGEAIAISILRDQKTTFVEDAPSFQFRKFDGTQITI